MALRGFVEKEREAQAKAATALAEKERELSAALHAADKARHENDRLAGQLERAAEAKTALEKQLEAERAAAKPAARSAGARLEFTKAAFTGIIARGEGGTGWLGKDEWPAMALEMGRKMAEAWERDLAPKTEAGSGR